MLTESSRAAVVNRLVWGDHQSGRNLLSSLAASPQNTRVAATAAMRASRKAGLQLLTGWSG
jgi:hypothetical protein